MKLSQSISVLLCGAALWRTPSSWAQTAAPVLPEVTVTAASGTGRSLTVPSIEASRAEIAATTPGGAGVIDAETYKRGRSTTLKDALDFAPGVYVQPRFGAEEARISIRGSGIQRTFHGRGLKLLQDGVPLNLADGGFDFQAVEPLATRSIEIYRGANALEYGSTTLGGAINFVTFTGHDAAPLAARAEYGSFESFRAQVSSGAVFGPFDYYVSLSHSSQDGFREHSQQNNQRLFANLGYRLSEHLETRFYITYAQSDSELPGELTKEQLEADPRQAARVPPALRGFQPVARFDRATSNWKRDFELFRIANTTTYLNGDHRLSLTSFWARKDLDHPILFVIDQLSNDFGFNLRYDNEGDLFGHENRLTVGFSPTWGVVQDNRYENVFGNRGAKFADSEQWSSNLDFYLQDVFHLTPKLAVAAGAQVSYARRENRDDFPVTAADPDHSDRQDWWGFSPKLGLIYEITPRAQAFFNVSRSFEPPSFGELGNPASGGAGLVSLDAQRGTTIEAGTRGRHDRWAWDLAYYYTWLDDELLQFQVLPGLTQTVNAGRTIHQGIEAAADVDLVRDLFTRTAPLPVRAGKSAGKDVAPLEEPPPDRLVLRQLYLWNDFRFDDDPTYGNRRLPGIPEHYYRAELTYEHPSGFYIGPNVEWVIEKYNVDSAETLFADSYFLLGAKIGYRAPRGFSVYFEAKNITDKTYTATAGVVNNAFGRDAALFFPGEGRGYFAGIEWRW
jgi:iron complex outermembrane receptor protein